LALQKEKGEEMMDLGFLLAFIFCTLWAVILNRWYRKRREKE